MWPDPEEYEPFEWLEDYYEEDPDEAYEYAQHDLYEDDYWDDFYADDEEDEL